MARTEAIDRAQRPAARKMARPREAVPSFPRLEVVSALHGRSMDRVVEPRQLDLEDQHSSRAPDRGVATRPLAGLEICFAIGQSRLIAGFSHWPARPDGHKPSAELA
jgi:hypothetical protein